MANSDITFDTGDVSSIITGLRNNVDLLTSVSNSVKSSFTTLTELGLFSDQITKFTSKLNNLKNVHESIITAIGGQSYRYDSVENKVSATADDYMSYYNGSRNSNGGGYNSLYNGEGDISLSSVENGEEINTDTDIGTLDLKLDNLDDKTLIELINFINKNMGGNLTFNSLLDVENSEVLVAYLQKFFKAYGNQELSAEDIKKVRELLLKKLLNTNLNMPKDLKENSLIKFKPYLIKMAESLNVDCYTLLSDDSYKDVRNTIFTNLYNGTAIGDTSLLDDDYGKEFQKLAEEKAKTNNVTVQEVIDNPILLV